MSEIMADVSAKENQVYYYYSDDEKLDSDNSSDTGVSNVDLDPYREGTLKQVLRDKPSGHKGKLISAVVLLLTYIGLCLGGSLDPKYDPYDSGEVDDNGAAIMMKPVMCDTDEEVIGLIWGVLLMIYSFANSGYWYTSVIFKFVPTITLMYFLPGVLGTCRVYDANESNLYSVASHYCLPACLMLLCLGCDLDKLSKLGWRSILCFLTGTLGIVVGGPLGVSIIGAIDPSVVCGDVWKSLTYLAGSWIGGGANAAAMVDIFQPPSELMPIVIAIDSVGSMFIMIGIFTMIEHQVAIDRKLKANTRPIRDLIQVIEKFEEANAKNPTAADMLIVVSTAMVFTAVSNGVGQVIADGFNQLPGKTGEVFAMMAFNTLGFWRVMLATIIGLTASFTPLKRLDNVGASKIATVMLYFLILTIGMHMDVTVIATNPGLFFVAIIWLLTHAILIAAVGIIIKAPLFYMCIGSQANIGAAASAPVVAAAFHPCLAPVGAIFGIFGYVIGTWAAWACSMMMQMASPGVCPA